VQQINNLLPSHHFLALAKAVRYYVAGFDTIWLKAGLGAAAFGASLAPYRGLNNLQ